MKLHDLKPAPGSRRAKTRVGRGIAAGQGKTAGRGTKGQKARAGGTIPAWFEGGQTPIHIRVPKLRGFNNQRFRIEYQVVNVGQISAYAEAGRFGVEIEQPKPAKGKSAEQPVATINAEVLAKAGLIRGGEKPLKVLGQGEVSQKLFVAADTFSASARQKIEAAGGFVQALAEPKPAAESKKDRKARKAAKSDAAASGQPAAPAAADESPAAAPKAAVETETAPAPTAEPEAAEPEAEEGVTEAPAAIAEAPEAVSDAAAKSPEVPADGQTDAPTEAKPKPRRRASKTDETA